MRDQFRSLNPGMSFGQLAKYTAAMYAEIPPAEKQAWSERAEQDKARYLHELQNYTPPPGYDSKGDAIMVINDGGTEHLLPVFPGQQQQFQQQQPQRPTGKSKYKTETRDPNAPKRNLPPFILYQNAMREQFQKENPGMTFGQLAKYTSHMYKNLTAEEKASWEARAQEDKLRYVGQMANYTPPPGHNAQGIMLLDPNSANNNVKRRAKRKTKDKDPNAPKRACGAYVFFTNEMRPIVMKEIPGIKFIEMGRILGERWRNLSVEDKKKFEDMATEDKARFQMEMQQYTAEKSTLLAQQQQAQREQQQQMLSQHQSPHHQYQQYLSQQQQQMLLSQQHQLQQQHIHPVSSGRMPSIGNTSSHGHYSMDPYHFQQPQSDCYGHQSYNAERI